MIGDMSKVALFESFISSKTVLILGGGEVTLSVTGFECLFL